MQREENEILELIKNKISKHDSLDIVPTLSGTSTYFERTCSYCYRHHKFMTPKQVSSKGCLGKQCHHIIKLEHQYWYDRALKKEAKKNKAKGYGDVS